MRYQIRVRKGVGNYVIVEVTKKRLFRSPEILASAAADLSTAGYDFVKVRKGAVLEVERAEVPRRPTDAWRWRHVDA